jgi:hypothetical protein
MTIHPRDWFPRLLVGLAAGLVTLPALAAEPCSGFAWDVRQERALFASPPQSAAAGSSVASAAELLADHLFRLTLMPQPQVTFASSPEKKMLSDGAFAGLAVFQVATAGTYRIAMDEPFWIDVVLDGRPLPSKDFQGAPGCNAPRKIVEFDLPAAKNLVLQFSGATSATTLVTITRAPAPQR